MTTPLGLARGKAGVIAINESWRLVPWADMLFGMDGTWWVDNKGVPEFKGKKFTASPMAMKKYGIDLFASIGAISGLRAIYLAERMKANPILLVGFEMHPKNGVHWHKPHGGRARNPGRVEMAIWRTEVERVAPKFVARGTRIINCTPDSALTCFPFMTFAEAINASNYAH